MALALHRTEEIEDTAARSAAAALARGVAGALEPIDRWETSPAGPLAVVEPRLELPDGVIEIEHVVPRIREFRGELGLTRLVVEVAVRAVWLLRPIRIDDALAIARELPPGGSLRWLLELPLDALRSPG